MSSRLLITGATGMIGSLLSDALVARGVEFSVMLRAGDSGDRIAGKPGVISTEGDFDDPHPCGKHWTALTERFC